VAGLGTVVALESRRGRIDLLRGISILLVLLHHFNIAYRMDDTMLARLFGWPGIHAVFRNGNYAVTMFFVISGFLITSNAERRWGGLAHLHAASFYQFRAARILPCLLLLLVLVNGLAAFSIPIFQDHPEFGGAVPLWVVDLASLTFWMNVLMGQSGWVNYVLCVQWSLSIEEVFYLSFPVFCLVFRRDRWLVLAWGAFILLGPIWRATHQATEYGELYAYFSCFDGVAIGCCAAVLGKYVRWPAGLTMWPAQVAIGLAMAWFYLWRWIGDTAVYGVTVMAFGTGLLLMLQVAGGSERPGWVYRGSMPLRFCGRLSYELYLFHLVVLGALRTIWAPGDVAGDEKLVLMIAYLGLSGGVALVIGRFYSDPLNRHLRGRGAGILPIEGKAVLF
jgi:peptidoglycan/LPS O-acetylase OafA/YrhL